MSEVTAHCHLVNDIYDPSGRGLLEQVGQRSYDSDPDLNDDGIVNVLDLAVVGANFLKSC